MRRATTIPIASGEREFTRFDFQDLLERRALDIAQPDVARAGGMTEIRRIAALTSAHGVRLAPHAWGSGVLFAASLHVAMAAPNCHILEVTQGYMPMMWDSSTSPSISARMAQYTPRIDPASALPFVRMPSTASDTSMGPSSSSRSILFSLPRILQNGRSLADILVAEGLARRWNGARKLGPEGGFRAASSRRDEISTMGHRQPRRAAG